MSDPFEGESEGWISNAYEAFKADPDRYRRWCERLAGEIVDEDLEQRRQKREMEKINKRLGIFG